MGAIHTMHIWIIIVLSVATLLTVYLGSRLVNPTPLSRKAKIWAWVLIAILLFGQRFTWILYRQGIENILFSTIDWIGFTFLGLVSILVMFMFVRDLPIIIKRLLSLWVRLFSKRSKRPYFREPNHERRRFMLNMSNAAILGVTVPMTGFAVAEARAKPTVIHNEFPVADLPDGLDGFTIAQISDTHVGPTIRRDWMRMVVDETNSLGADMIVHTGDMVDGSVDALKNDVAPLADLSAPYGVYMCTGNHEYYSGVEQWLSEAARLGMTVLNNEHRLIKVGNGRLLLGGVTDIRSGRLYPSHQSSPVKAMAKAPDHDVSLLLAHQPISIYEGSKAGFDIQLSGHTHGGQYFPWTLVIHLVQPFVKGWYMHEGTQLYINVGTGYWGPPMRMGTEPEITLHTLKKA